MIMMRALHGILTFAIILGAKAESEVTCEDSTAKFLLDNGMKRTCNRAKMDPWMQCKKREVRENCPKTCLTCPVSAYYVSRMAVVLEMSICCYATSIIHRFARTFARRI